MGRRQPQWQAGDLLTRQERIALRTLVSDLQAQLNRTPESMAGRRGELERQIAAVERQREEDRRTRARRPKVPAPRPSSDRY